MRKAKLFTDGACRGNPGPGGYGVILAYQNDNTGIIREEHSAGFEWTTNNRMELLSVIAGLGLLGDIPTYVEVVSDSTYVVNAVNSGWLKKWVRNGWRSSTKSSVKNTDLWKRYLEVSKIHVVTFRWVRGHNGHKENERCDQLAVAASCGPNLLIDDGTNQ